jgi:cellobiose transport system permease protein
MKVFRGILTYAVMIIILVLSVFPFYWMFVIASHTTASVNKFPPVFIPGDRFIANVNTMFSQIQFFKALLNSIFVSSTITIAQIFFCGLAAFAFSHIPFKGNKLLFTFILATLMIPGQLGLVPSYIIMTKLGWINDFKALIIPGIVSAFGIFWLKQYMEATIHKEIIESARIDGCSNNRTFFSIIVPMIKPALGTLAMLTFMYQWNDFVWPSIVLKDDSVQTIQIALRNLNRVYYRDVSVIMAGTFLATLPLLAIFIAFSRTFVSGITAGAMKG